MSQAPLQSESALPADQGRGEGATAHERLRRWLLLVLTNPHVNRVTLGLAMLLSSSYLALGRIGDDDFHAVATRASAVLTGVQRAPLDLFSLATPAHNLTLMEEGIFPWWTDRELLISFYRPLSSLTTWLDYRLWPHSPALMHLQSMLWFALLLASVRVVYRGLSLSPRHAALAFLLYALDDARSMPVAWLAQRNALIALAPAFLSILALHHARRTGAARYSWLGALSLFIGLQGGEAAIAACGYLVAYALVVDEAPLGARLRSLLPYLLTLLVWSAIYHSLGRGALHSGIYLDPGREPLAFARALAERLPILLLAQFALPFSEFWEAYPMIAPWLQPVMWCFAVAVLGGLFYVLRPLLREHKLLRFWLLGSLLATVPACAVHPEDRMLTATSLGAAQLIASFLLSVLDQLQQRQGFFVRAAAIALVLIHGVLAPCLLPVRSFDVYAIRMAMAQADHSIPGGAEAKDATVVLLNPPNDVFAVYFSVYREASGAQLPGRFRWLATGETDLRVERVDAHTLKLKPAAGFLATSTQCMFRRADRRFQLNERISLAETSFVITALTEDGRPQEVLVRFDQPLESAHYRFFKWGDQEYEPFRVPVVGSSVTLPKVELADLLSNSDHGQRQSTR